MRFLIAVETQGTQWEVAVTCRDDAAWQRNRQMAKREDVGGWHFPVPDGLPAAGAAHYDLCLPENAAARRAAYNSIVNRQAANVVEKFGRYLFESLLGDVIWQAITDQAGQAGAPFIELALRWPNTKKNKSLHRLPWEMMHSERAFLAQGHTPAKGSLIEVAVTRIVADAQFDSRQLSLPPRMLFVMGTTPDDPAIRPGAEIMGLLRQLKRDGRGIHSREISEARPSQMHDVVGEFLPDLVHFICHGNVEADTGRGYLEMVPDQGGASNRQFADQLLPNLRAGGKLPAMVVLSACYSAGASAGKTLATGEMAPLAAELVAGGVPIVVGMSGRVSDHACRLFTRRFGDAILKGEPLIPATAQGRRTIFVEGRSAYASVDWAFPAIFLSERVESDYAPVPSQQAMPSVVIEDRIKSYDVERPPVFCSRNEFFGDYYKLFSNDSPAVLAVYGDEGFGKSRVLEEFTAQAIRDGHLPVAIIVKGLAEPPRDIESLRSRLYDALRRAATTFNLNPPATRQLLFLKDTPQQPVDKTNRQLDPLIQDELLDKGKVTAKALQMALQIDLAGVLEQARAKEPNPKESKMKAVVLLDAIEQYDKDFLHDLCHGGVLGAFGVGSMQERIPAILAFAYSGPATETLKGLLESHPSRPWLAVRQLKPFSNTGEDLLAYQRVLLNPFALEMVPGTSDKPWVINDQIEEKIAIKHQAKFRRYLKGIPKQLTDPVLFALAEDAVEDQYLIEADDERLLKLLRGEK